MIGRQGGSTDFLAVQRDDELLDRLGRRLDVPSDDRVAGLLRALVLDVDTGLAEPPARPAPGPAAEAPAATDPGREAADVPAARARRSARATAVALVLGATLSVSGVAAAVTGDPLAPYRGLLGTLAGDGLPENAARIAAVNRALAGAQGALGRGDASGARERLLAAREQLAGLDLTPGQRRAFERRLSALEAALAGAAEKPAGAERAPGKDRTPGAADDRTKQRGDTSQRTGAGAPPAADEAPERANGTRAGERTGPDGAATGGTGKAEKADTPEDADTADADKTDADEADADKAGKVDKGAGTGGHKGSDTGSDKADKAEETDTPEEATEAERVEETGPAAGHGSGRAGSRR